MKVQVAAKAYHIEIEDSFLDRQFELTEPMGPYKPSSLIDFLDDKPVEIDAIWGEALRRGAHVLDVHEHMYCLLPCKHCKYV